MIAHELAHMWWYALIGSDQARSPWLDEGFATLLGGRRSRAACRTCDAPEQLLGPAQAAASTTGDKPPARVHHRLLRGRAPAPAARPPHRPRAVPHGAEGLRARAPLWLAHGRRVHGRDGRSGERARALDDLWFDFGAQYALVRARWRGTAL